jgi:hypothetical protein
MTLGQTHPNMNILLFRHLAACLLSCSMIACTSDPSDSNSESQPIPASSHTEGAGHVDEAVVNVKDEGACAQYVKGRSFSGGNARISFELDGTVGAYSIETGELVFGGTLSIGPVYGQASRSISVVSMVGGDRLELLLSSDGKIMDKSSMTIYKP